MSIDQPFTGDIPPDPTPATRSQGELTPPPRKPPTAISAVPSGPEPRPPRQQWPKRGGSRLLPLPHGVVQAVDAALDVLDDVGDAVRTALARVVR